MLYIINLTHLWFTSMNKNIILNRGAKRVIYIYIYYSILKLSKCRSSVSQSNKEAKRFNRLNTFDLNSIHLIILLYLLTRL